VEGPKSQAPDGVYVVLRPFQAMEREPTDTVPVVLVLFRATSPYVGPGRKTKDRNDSQVNVVVEPLERKSAAGRVAPLKTICVELSDDWLC